jgi:glycosyltransferase involved in cell wall biosynthesis
MRKVLIILYYWPPAGGSAVQRWLKFSKYLPGYGWEPVIYAPENAEYPDLDPGLIEEVPGNITVLKQPVTEPVNFYKRFVGGKSGGKIAASMSMKSELKGYARFKHNIAWWIRSNFFIPDAHFLWIRPSVKFLKSYLKENPVDVIVTTGPPQSLHMIGYGLRHSLKIPWIADFRDPWTSIDFYASLNLTRWADKKHHRLESKVLQTSDHIIAIGPNMKEEFSRLGAKSISVITNGFDETDFSTKSVQPDDKFSIVHLGTLSATRNSLAFWKALASKAAEDPSFASALEVKLIGALNYSVIESIESLKLSAYISSTEFIPHQEAIEILRKARVLLLLVNNSKNSRGIITGKFFEYLAVGRPVLLVGPLDGDAARILEETKSGFAAEFEDEKMIRKRLDHLFDLYKTGNLNIQEIKASQYTRKNLTRLLARQLDELAREDINVSSN